MLSITDLLFENLYSTLRKKTVRNFDRLNHRKIKKSVGEVFNTENNSKINRSESDSVKRLEKRIDVLELQNDQLIYFLDFLIDRLPQLIDDIHFEKTNSIEETNSENINSLNGHKNSSRLFDLSKSKLPNPTPREAEVLELLIKGFCAKEIANKLFISETTVITHKKNLKEKFNAKNTAELISKVGSTIRNEI